jgi:hypothetical protein
MTPKEKAKELVSKFNFEHTGQTYILHQTVDESKRCALIAVDEIIKALEIDAGNWIKWNETKKYLNKVKQEIQEL